mgnify:CR=1 FL=1
MILNSEVRFYIDKVNLEDRYLYVVNLGKYHYNQSISIERTNDYTAYKLLDEFIIEHISHIEQVLKNPYMFLRSPSRSDVARDIIKQNPDKIYLSISIIDQVKLKDYSIKNNHVVIEIPK